VINARLYFNGDDCFLCWATPPISNCWGFAIRRNLVTADGKHSDGLLHNYTGFKGDNNLPHRHRPSDVWPFQRYTWTDHGVGVGDTISYTISAVTKTGTDLNVDAATSVTVGPVVATCQGDGDSFAYFNRGILLSQFMTKHLPVNWTAGDLIALKNALEVDDNDLRAFLTGDLGKRLLDLLTEAKNKSWHVFAALYEIDDHALISHLADLKQRAHVVLSNGSKKKKGEDSNKAALPDLVGIDLTRRMLWSEGLGHNKFVVFAKSPTKPFMVWTGSTNWATTGLCTQLNNGILVEDKDIAETYVKQWNLLKDDKRTGPQGQPMHFGPALMQSNDVPKSGLSTSIGKWRAWFTRTSTGQDLADITTLIDGAKDAILFLMFEPGTAGLLPVLQKRLDPGSPTYDPKVYIHGVVNSLKAAGTDVEVSLVSRSGAKPKFDLQVIQPEGVGASAGLAGWATEVTRKDFLLGQGGQIGHAIIHSKVIVIDPFTDPIVVTGSHNFSQPASDSNDENLLIIQGNAGLAQRYAVNVMGVYQHYRWREYLKDCKAKGVPPWDGLSKDDKWQWKDAPHNAELKFWLRA